MRRVLELHKIDTRMGEGCTTTNLRGLLQYLGFSKPDALMANEWGFFYTGEFQPGSLSGIQATSTDRYAGLRRMGFQAQVLKMADPDAAWERARQSIDSGVPVLAWVDEFMLSYVRESKLRAGKPTLGDHYVHNLIIYGYEDYRFAWVSDRGYKKGPVKICELKAARSSTEAWRWDMYGDAARACPTRIENRHLVLSVPGNVNHFENALSIYVKDSIRHAEHTEDEYSALRGPVAIIRFARDLSKLSHVIGDDEARFLHRTLLSVVEERKFGVALFEATAETYSPEPWTTIANQASLIHRSWLRCQAIAEAAWRKREFFEIEHLSRRIMDVAIKEQHFYDQLNEVRV